MLRGDNWHTPSHTLTLTAGAVHVWRIALQQPEATRDRLARTLDAGERARIARFALERDRDHATVAHGAAREVLARYLACAPEAVAFSVSSQGKPEVVEQGRRGDGALRFNLAHSGAVALVSVTQIGATGVDVERTRSDMDVLAIAERFFAPEEHEALRSLPMEQCAAHFYRLWTCKEAYLKGMGAGLTVPLQRIRVRLGEREWATVEDRAAGMGSRWSLVELAPGEGYAGAVAVEGAIEGIALWEWAGGMA